MAGYSESWGRGIEIVIDECRNYGIPEPIIEEYHIGMVKRFLKIFILKII